MFSDNCIIISSVWVRFGIVVVTQVQCMHFQYVEDLHLSTSLVKEDMRM